MIETTVESIRVSLVTQNRAVILKERDGSRHLVIWIGGYEAEAIALELQGVTPTRPLSWDVMRAICEELGANVDHIVISELTNQIYFARIVLTIADRTVEIDARPSDAIALAVRADARILVDEGVMDSAAVEVGMDESISLQSAGSSGEARGRPPGAADDEELDVFRDFINSLDLEDFDKGNQAG